MELDDELENNDIEVTLDDNAIELEMVNDVVVVEGGTKDYNLLINKPSINNITLTGNLSLEDLNIQEEGDYPEETISNSEIEEIFE